MFLHNGVLYRQVNHSYRPHYDRFLESGLAADLRERSFLIPHEEADPSEVGGNSGYRLLRPERIPFISYPYEWSFSQLKDAALLTLKIQARCLKHGMSLKDASAYNVQFVRGRPILIDTLSFEVAEEGQPWVAYRQFCQHFLAPLALMAHRDVRLSQLLRVHLDGIPLDLASSLLPARTWLSPSLLMHVHLHARAQRKYAGTPATATATVGRKRMSRTAIVGMLESLAGAITKLRWNPAGTEWADYYQDTNYSEPAMAEKERLVAGMLAEIRPKMVWDLGANVGRFSRLTSRKGIDTVAFDVDPAAVERNYRESSSSGDSHMLPLVSDLTNPSSAIGWAGTERLSLQQRGPVDCVLALALIHHLAIGNNVPLPSIAEWFAQLARSVVVEFVPKSDTQVQRMLASRVDIFDDYAPPAFEAALEDHFKIAAKTPIAGSERVLYLLTRR
jgi:ribosomal protein L11 methylase PrmA